MTSYSKNPNSTIKETQKELFYQNKTFYSNIFEKLNEPKIHIIGEIHDSNLELMSLFFGILALYISSTISERDLKKLIKLFGKSFLIIYKSFEKEIEEKSRIFEELTYTLKEVSEYIRRWKGKTIRKILNYEKDYERVIFIVEGTSEKSYKSYFVNNFLKKYVGKNYLKHKKIDIYFLDDVNRDISKKIEDAYLNALYGKRNLEEIHKLQLEREKEWKKFIENSIQIKESDVVIVIVGLGHVYKYINDDLRKNLTVAKIVEHITGKYIKELDKLYIEENLGEFIEGFKTHLENKDKPIKIHLHLPNYNKSITIFY
ncbi:MAG: hypothetical protein QXL82_02140 [Candidatus Aenigmatarchaeota archaeon]